MDLWDSVVATLILAVIVVLGSPVLAFVVIAWQLSTIVTCFQFGHGHRTRGFCDRCGHKPRERVV